MNLRIGQGFDIHRFGKAQPGASQPGVVLGGVFIPHESPLEGHSDADVLTHAIMDAILGGSGQSDIGVHFPNTDESLKGISSIVLLKRVMEMTKKIGFTIINLDCTVLAEAPKVNLFREAIIINLAEALALPKDAIAIKATTMEGIGAVGRKEGMAAMAVVLLQRGGSFS